MKWRQPLDPADSIDHRRWVAGPEGPGQRLRTQLPYLPQACRLVWMAADPWTLIWAGSLLAQGILPVATVYLRRATVEH